MFTDNKDFYPTPQNLIDKMLDRLDWKMIHTVLEPSAGKGNIVEALKKKESFNNRWYTTIKLNIDCIENDVNLRAVLKEKDFRVVHDDFLTYDTMKEYDLIIMNPPFSNGCKHLLKALEMQQRNGGAIICLLNAETLKNECSNERIMLNRMLEEYNADIQYIQDAFMDAERKTNVEIALIKVKLPDVQRDSFIFDSLEKAKEQREYTYNTENTQLAENDFLKAIVEQYKMEIEAGVKLIKEYYAMSPHILYQFGKDKQTGQTIQTGGCVLNLSIGRDSASVNGYIREIRGKYWSALFENPKFIGQLTNNLQREYYNKVEELKDYEFSLHNIYELKIDMSKKVIKGIEDTIISLFEELSNKYSYYDECSKNIHYFNGWKTNKAWIINKKVIIPLRGWRDLEYSWGGFKPSDREVVNKLRDIEKCFNYLDGGLTETVDLQQSLEFAEEYGESKDIVLKYFNVTFYKKGTCHITFTNEELLKKFNIFGAQHKGWLPPSYGKKKYSDMTSEEKAVVNDFEGEAEYNKVMCNTSYYLADTNSMLMLDMAEQECDYMSKKIYYLHSCNEWKEYSSMRLLFIGTSQQKLKMKISKEIEEGNMEYKPVTTRYDYVDGEFKLVDKENTPKEQAKLFRQDWETETRDNINSELKYGDFDYTYNNEEMQSQEIVIYLEGVCVCMDKERYQKYVEIAKRAENEGIYSGERISLLMDIESADQKFHLRLDDWLNADEFNFAHDLYGIMNNINRTEFPATDFGLFIPRFAGK